MNPGTRLGNRYRLEQRIAGGGMGEVWRGTDERLERPVAVKILHEELLEEPGFAQRFLAEAKIMAKLKHPNVVAIYDFGNDPQAPAFLVMEYVEGEALSRTLSRVGRLTARRSMLLIAQAAAALEAAHELNIVHRDVKPGNLLVRPNGELVLTDFGIARSAGATQLTQTGAVLGTAPYISPEQANGEPATRLSDIYSLGVVAYQCLAGRRPFEGDNPWEVAMKHVREVAPPLPGDIPPAVRQVVEVAMAKDPARRWPTAAAMAAEALRVANEQPGDAGATVVVDPVARPDQRTRLMPAAPVPPTPRPAPVAAAPIAAAPVAGAAPRPSARSVVAVVVAAVIVAICVGAGIAYWQHENPSTAALATTEGRTTS